MVSSRVYPGLERKPGGPDNWVEAAGGLPPYIERIAKHLHYEQGFSISRAIATAVNTVRRWAKGGTVTKHGTTKRVSAKTQALAAKAVMSWETKKRAGDLRLSDVLLQVIDLAMEDEAMAFDLLDLAKSEKCAICSLDATKKVIWADGRAYQPSCDGHVKAVQDMLMKKNGDMTELTGVHDLSDADVSKTDTMVALMLPKAVAQKVAVEGGVPVEDMHITLTFHGEVDDDKFAKLVADLQAWAKDIPIDPKLKGTIGGLGCFPAEDPEKGKPWWIPVDVPGINTLHEQVKAVADRSAPAFENHGYTPHSTLTYGDDAPEPVESTPVEFSSVWVVRGNDERVEIPLGAGTGADLSESAILQSSDRSAVNLEAMAERAGQISDPVQRAAARQKVLDLASTIPPRNKESRKKRATDGRPSYDNQGKWKHGFIPANTAAKEAKAKGSPIAMQRMNKLFGKSKDEQAATGRAGSRSGGTRKTNAKEIRINEKSHPVSEGASDIGALQHTKFESKGAKPDSKLPEQQKEASKSTRIPERAKQNWDEIPESLKTVRNGKKYVMAEFGGKQYITEWVGGVNQVEQTALAKRKVVRTLSSVDAANMSPDALRSMLNNPRTPASVKRTIRKALKAIAKKESA